VTAAHRDVIRRHPEAVVAATALVALGATLLLAAMPQLWWGYRFHHLQVALETGNALSASLAAFLVVGRLRRAVRLSDVALAAALATFATTCMAFDAVPEAISLAPVGLTIGWTNLLGNLLAVALFAAAAVLPQRRIALRRPSLVVGAVATVPLALMAIALIPPAQRLPTGLSATETPVRPDLADLLNAWPVVLVQAAAVSLFCVAAVGFTRTAHRSADVLLGWLGVAATLGAAGALNLLLYPSLDSSWLYPRDLFRFCFYFVILVGAAREIRGYWETATTVAVLEERRRIAREIHDGLSQELAYIVRRAGRAARRGDPDAAAIAAAAGRALDESRHALATLTRPLDEPFERALADAVEAAAARAGTRVACDISDGLTLRPAARAELMRIACEAVTNAARHGRAAEVRVEFAGGARPRLLITDDGIGFDLVRSSRGFGLVSMEERAAALGGELRLRSEPGSGTTVEVVLPE
jgi:signal transduction histidine kinase